MPAWKRGARRASSRIRNIEKYGNPSGSGLSGWVKTIHRGRGNNQSLVASSGSCPHWFRFLYARIVIPTDINMGGTTSTKMPAAQPLDHICPGRSRLGVTESAVLRID